MTQAQIQDMINDAVAKLAVQQAQVGLKPTIIDKKAAMLAAKDKKTARLFAKRGFKDVVLMDRNDPTKDFNCRSYQGWQSVGHQVTKGSKNVNGLFHITQTEKIVTKPAPVATATADQFSQIGT